MNKLINKLNLHTINVEGDFIISKEQLETFAKEYHSEQLRLCGVGSSTYKIAISDSFCTYDFEMELPKTTCIRDIARRLYASFGLKEDNGRLRK